MSVNKNFLVRNKLWRTEFVVKIGITIKIKTAILLKMKSGT